MVILDHRVPGIKPSDIDTMFISTNYEEDSQTQESEANDDNALVRWVQPLVCATTYNVLWVARMRLRVRTPADTTNCCALENCWPQD
eukprot:1137212-Pelagomonas_calceolata.AAC.4